MARVKGSRSYSSQIRRGQAPTLICAAARDLFTTKGYVATSIEDIAAAAGVARPTVFTAVGPKPAILKRVVDEALAGDDAPIALADRPWFKEALDEPDARRAIQLHARNMCWITHRFGRLSRVLESAAAVDAGAATLWADHQRQRRAGMAEIAASLAAKATLRVDEQTATDTMWALQPSAYQRLVIDAGWPPERYQRWLADTLERAFLD